MRKEFGIYEASIYRRMSDGRYFNLTDFDCENPYCIEHIKDSVRTFSGRTADMLLVVDDGLRTEQVINTSLKELASLVPNKRLLNNVPDSMHELVLVTYLNECDFVQRHTIVLNEDGSLYFKTLRRSIDWCENVAFAV